MTAAVRFPPPTVRALSGGRLHLHHGPIDVILKAWGKPEAVETAYAVAEATFGTILGQLTEELVQLRQPASANPDLAGPVASRMLVATRSFPDHFITPMAAVAGAVADHLLAVMVDAAPLDRAFVNDGGDIAVFLGGKGDTITIAAAGHLDTGHLARLGDVHLVGPGRFGIATSGRHGRSFSLGIADAVTVIAADSATADAAATLIANAVDVDSPCVRRQPASSLDPDSDLGHLPVTTGVEPLGRADRDAALAAGLRTAQTFIADGRIMSAALALHGAVEIAGPWPR